MKKTILTTALLLSSLSNALESKIEVYECFLKGAKAVSATLIYNTENISITWMPTAKLKTTKANASGQILNNGEAQFKLFGFQDQADFLVLPQNSQNKPEVMDVYTYHDNDDFAEDIQKFTCKSTK